MPRELTRKVPEDAADVSVEQEILAIDIKVIDLLAPYYKGDKTGLNKTEARCITTDEAEAEYYDTCEWTCLD